MPIITPDSAKEVVQRSKVDVLRALTESNPFLQNHWLSALITAGANRTFAFYFALQQALLEALPDTAVDLLERWAAIWKVNLQPASPARGSVWFRATGTVPIAIDTVVVSSDGLEYTTTEAAVTIIDTFNGVTITRSGTTATLTTTSAHGMASNALITVIDADQPEYNVVGSEIIVTDTDEMTYEMTADPGGDATGTIIMRTIGVSVPVESSEFGQEQNQVADTPLTLQTPIATVSDTAQVTFDAITGGTDQETAEALRSRYLDRMQNSIAHFNVPEITAVAKAVPGVTRVFVDEAGSGGMDPGQTTIFFMRDNDASPIPDSTEVDTVFEAIKTIIPANTLKGATAADADVFVKAPVPDPQVYTFSGLDPNTTTMQDAIDASLEQFYAERTEPGVDILEEAYRSAIYNTVDPATGDTVVSFTLSAPASGDLTIAAGEIGTLGNTTYP